MAITIDKIIKMKEEDKPITMVTAYDYQTAKLVEEAGIPLILVGDSLGMVVLGYDSTIPVTMDDMLHHIKAVTRGAVNSFVIGDMPFMSYHLSEEQALENAALIIQEGGAKAVKLEGGISVSDKIKRIVECGIPVMGHIGLTPQSVHHLGGYKVQGKSKKAAQGLLNDALAIEEAGAFAIVLEAVPEELAQLITKRLSIPVIGIGAGVYCDGQVQVINDIIGYTSGPVPKHAKKYINVNDVVKNTLSLYRKEVIEHNFPAEKQTVHVADEVIKDL